MTTRPRPSMSAGLLVAVVALVLTTAVVSRALYVLDWDATAFVGFGSDASATREYAESRLGEVFLRGALGHDGKFFFVQANDPWLTDPSNHAQVLDFPVYRSQRMLYPLLAGGLGLFSPQTIVWSLLAVNVLVMAWGTWGTARLALILGGSPWWGLAFLANVGLFFALAIDSADILAAACAIWAVAYLYEDRLPPAIALFAGAALTREVMILCALGAAVGLWTKSRRRQAFYVFGIPVLVLGIWEVFLRIRLGPDDAGTGNIGLPFAGLVEAIPSWIGDPVTLAAGLAIIAFAVSLVRRWWSKRTLLGWVFVGFIPMAVVMTAKVWTNVFDFTRVLAPLLTAAVLLVFVESHRSDGQLKSIDSEAAVVTGRR